MSCLQYRDFSAFYIQGEGWVSEIVMFINQFSKFYYRHMYRLCHFSVQVSTKASCCPPTTYNLKSSSAFTALCDHPLSKHLSQLLTRTLSSICQFPSLFAISININKHHISPALKNFLLLIHFFALFYSKTS